MATGTHDGFKASGGLGASPIVSFNVSVTDLQVQKINAPFREGQWFRKMNTGALETVMGDLKLGSAMSKSSDPDPSGDYKSYPKAELETFFLKIKDDLTLEKILEGPLGFWLFTKWAAEQRYPMCRNAAYFLVDVATMKACLGSKQRAKRKKILETYFPVVQFPELSYSAPSMCRPRRPVSPDLEGLYERHVKVVVPDKGRRRSSLSGPWPIQRSDTLLKSDDEPIETTFDVVEDLILMYLERHILPLWLTEERNPDLYDKYLRYLKIQHDEAVNLQSFTVFRTMGRGGFGLVKGCRTVTTGRMYAMKEMQKARVKLKHSKKLCYQEVWALQRVNSPFCVNLKYAFQTPDALVMILDLMMGGDLKFHLHRQDLHRFPEAWIRYYGARILLGLEVLHNAGIVYRDLKPENVLMDADGRTRLSDMGLAVQESSDLRGIAGTPGYCSPEMLRGDPYDRRVDFFSLGCTLYEFAASKTPFRSKEAASWNGIEDRSHAINVATLEMDVPYPDYFSADFADLCRSLFIRDPIQRSTLSDILDHPFFANTLKWDLMRADEFDARNSPEAPPIIPGKTLNIEDADHIGNFNECEHDNITVLDSDFPRDEWSFVSETAFQSEVVWLLQYQLSHDAALAYNGNNKKSSACHIA